jgi:hypothetical protein
MSQNENTKPSVAQSVLVEVADALKASPATVRSRLVTALTERELVKRVDMLDKGLAKAKELKREVDKIRPADMFDSEGNKVPGHFTKQQHEELKKAKEKLSKLEAALEKAFAGEGFDKLANLVAGKSSEDEDKTE